MNQLADIYRHRWRDDELERLERVWRVITADFLQRFVDINSEVLDVGAGFCHFINAVKARRRIALDANPAVRDHAAPGVETLVTDDLSLSIIDDESLDVVFVSNFLEHLQDSTAVIALLRAICSKLRSGGKLLVLQPNFRAVGAAYFDFVDHRIVLTDSSLREALEVAGFRIERLIRRFLPYTSKSRLPKSPRLAALYLKLPPLWRLFGGQAFAVAVKD